MRSGHSRRTSTRCTQGNFASAARGRRRARRRRNCRRCASHRALDLGARRCAPARRAPTTSRTGNSGERSEQLQRPRARTAAPPGGERVGGRVQQARVIPHGPLQDAHAQVLVGHAGGARRHRHQAVAGHARRGVHFEQPGLALRVQHQVDAPPAAQPRARNARSASASAPPPWPRPGRRDRCTCVSSVKYLFW